MVVVGGMDIQLQKQELFKPIKRSPPMLAVAIIPDGESALSTGLDFVLRKWNLLLAECTHSWEAGGPLNAIAVGPSGEWILASTVMGTLAVGFTAMAVHALILDVQRWY